jgi:arginine:ornithine antiporter/lysine permease
MTFVGGDPVAEAPAAGGDADGKAAGGTLSLAALSALVVGSMVGGGIFALPQAFAQATGVVGAVIAWSIAGTGMLMLAFVFQTLSRRKPALDAGIYAYARAGFGDYAGFLSALGYWISACLGNVSFLVLSQSTLGAFVPALGEGDTVASVAVGSVILWLVTVVLLRGVREAAAINTIVTIAKILPIVLFLAVVGLSIRADRFAANLWGADHVSGGSLFAQVRDTMLITVFVFIGIEGASVYSRYARRRRDVGRATLIGFLGVLCLFALVTILSYGVLPGGEIAQLRNPSMAGILAAVVGPWGAVFISVGVLVSVLGAYLSWSLLAAEVLFYAAKNGTMPGFLARENRSGAPAAAIWLTSMAAQIFLIVTLFAQSAYRFAVELTSAMSLMPYLLVAGYAFLLARRGETYEPGSRDRRTDLVRSSAATLYTGLLVFAGGMKFVLLSALIYAPGTVLYVLARREQLRPVFTRVEWVILACLVVGAVFALAALLTARLSL